MAVVQDITTKKQRPKWTGKKDSWLKLALRPVVIIAGLAPTATLHRRTETAEEPAATDISLPSNVPNPTNMTCERVLDGGGLLLSYFDALFPMKYVHYNVSFPVEPNQCYRYACSLTSNAAAYFCNRHSEKQDVPFAVAATLGINIIDAWIMGTPWMPEGQYCGAAQPEVLDSRMYTGKAIFGDDESPFEIRLKQSSCVNNEEWQEPL
ncbi:hypothetical protein ABW19_dt0200720 [Dactylella cylindrospora]|nr:hypothetical protein ABW19_dt0200720 [Dactylella cylindrospora]